MQRNKILKNTFKFMVSFIVITIFSFILLGLAVFFIPTNSALSDFLPMKEEFNEENLDWEKVKSMGGVGILLDSDGNTIKSYNSENIKEKYSKDEILDMLSDNRNLLDFSTLIKEGESTFLYKLDNGNRLLLIYPKNKIYKNINVDINQVMGNRSNIFGLFLLSILIVYLLLLFFIIKRLSKSLNRELENIKKEEDKRKDEFFRGLAHDIKTPLSSVIAFSTALKEGLVSEENIKDYYEGIYRNGNILKDRVNDMMELSILNEQGIYTPVHGDLLEFVRRYVGDNYMWYFENKGTIEVLFSDNASFFVDFDEKLLERVLQNILQNSIYHNEKPVIIQIDFNAREKKIIFKDNGHGVPEEIVDKVFEPMVTGDSSRSGEKLRGMGLANVKRIVNLHNWDIYYKNGFIIKF